MEECRICGSAAAAQPVDLVSNGYALVRCDGCGTVMINREPPVNELASTYDRLFTEGDYSCYREEHRQMLKTGAIGGYRYRRSLLRAAERRTRGRDLAEIGGGNGQFGMACFFTSTSLGRTLEAAGFAGVQVRKPRLYRPPLSSSGLREFARRMVHREEPRTLYAVAQKPRLSR